VRHPNIAKVIELIQHSDKQGKVNIYVISELARGSDLFKYMKKAVQAEMFNEELIAQIFKQAMSGVAYMHGVGVVHNDLKPDNILVLKDFRQDQALELEQGMVVINDFGCATMSKDRQFICGDPRYQSPETWVSMDELMDENSTKDIQKMPASADVWSMGVTLYELLSGGILPFIYSECNLHEIMSDPDTVDRLRVSITDKTELDLARTQDMSELSPACRALLRDMLRKNKVMRPTAAACLDHSWFTQKALKTKDTLASGVRFEFNADKSQARQILLNALASKLQREHKDASFTVFDRYDADHSGEIDREEFKKALKDMDQGPGTADMLFDRGDVDGNGMLSFTEFVAATFDWKASIGPEKLEEQLQSLIASLDGDNSGTIDCTELAKLFEGCLEAKDIRDVFSKIDEDGNGSIGAKEMHTFLFESKCKDDCLQRYKQRRSSLGQELDFGNSVGKGDPASEAVVTGGAGGVLIWTFLWIAGHPVAGGVGCASACGAGIWKAKHG